MTTTRRLLLVLASALAVGLAALSAPAQASSAAGGQLFVLHGVPGLVADVQVDGRGVGEQVRAGAVVGPIKVSAGRHEVSLMRSGKQVLNGAVTVGRGGSVDVVAHLPASPGGANRLTAYPNDLSPVGRGKTRLAVAHTAQVPPADIRVDRKPLLRNVANGEVLSVTVPQGTYSVDIVATGTSGPSVLGPADVTVRAGTLTRVFAFGNPAKGTMDVLMHVLPVSQEGSAVPGSVQTGTGGQLAGWLAGRR